MGYWGFVFSQNNLTKPVRAKISGGGVEPQPPPRYLRHLGSQDVKSKIHNCNLKLLAIRSPLSVFNTLYLPRATDANIIKIIQNRMDPTKSPGIDKIRMNDLEYMFGYNIALITDIVNASLDSATVPSMLKTSVVRPIYKAGAHDNYKNYRPVSLLSGIDKIIEDFVPEHVKAFLEKYKVIDKRQYAYQTGKSCETL